MERSTCAEEQRCFASLQNISTIEINSEYFSLLKKHSNTFRAHLLETSISEQTPILDIRSVPYNIFNVALSALWAYEKQSPEILYSLFTQLNETEKYAVIQCLDSKLKIHPDTLGEIIRLLPKDAKQITAVLTTNSTVLNDLSQQTLPNSPIPLSSSDQEAIQLFLMLTGFNKTEQTHWLNQNPKKIGLLVKCVDYFNIQDPLTKNLLIKYGQLLIGQEKFVKTIRTKNNKSFNLSIPTQIKVAQAMLNEFPKIKASLLQKTNFFSDITDYDLEDDALLFPSCITLNNNTIIVGGKVLTPAKDGKVVFLHMDHMRADARIFFGSGLIKNIVCCANTIIAQTPYAFLNGKYTEFLKRNNVRTSPALHNVVALSPTGDQIIADKKTGIISLKKYGQETLKQIFRVQEPLEIRAGKTAFVIQTKNKLLIVDYNGQLQHQCTIPDIKQFSFIENNKGSITQLLIIPNKINYQSRYHIWNLKKNNINTFCLDTIEDDTMFLSKKGFIITAGIGGIKFFDIHTGAFITCSQKNKPVSYIGNVMIETEERLIVVNNNNFTIHTYSKDFLNLLHFWKTGLTESTSPIATAYETIARSFGFICAEEHSFNLPKNIIEHCHSHNSNK